MRASTTISLFSLALSLYLAPFALADPTPKAGHAVKQLSDSNLFEAHLQHPELSHKRLPSEVINHHERDEPVTATPSAVPATTAAPVEISTSATSSPLPSTSAVRFTPRQPNHLIRHRAQRQGKQRLRKREVAEEEEGPDEEEAEETPEEQSETSPDSQPLGHVQLPFAGLQLSSVAREAAQKPGTLASFAELSRRFQ